MQWPTALCCFRERQCKLSELGSGSLHFYIFFVNELSLIYEEVPNQLNFERKIYVSIVA